MTTRPRRSRRSEPIAVVVRLEPAELVRANRSRANAGSDAGCGRASHSPSRRSAIPSRSFAQLRSLGAVVTPMALPDHHAFTAARRAESARDDVSGFECVVCTLKDAVKLGPLWPRQ